jgi:prevent-host-death family protein
MDAVWTLQDAKNRFSAVVDAAARGEPQMLRRRAINVLQERPGF